MAASDDAAFMRRAIALARARLGATGGNPAVGCVLVAESRVIAEAATAPGGHPHAEEQALAADLAEGAVAYITLEPCAARSSGAPACADLLLKRGVARVVVAAEDPSPLAAGEGLRRLRGAGVEVETGVLSEEAAPLYAAYWRRLAAAKA